MIRMFALTAALGAATPAIAQQAPTPPVAATPAAVDPTRLAIAERVVAALVPEGVYARMMRDQMPAIMDGMMAEMMGKTGNQLGIPDGGDETMGEVAAKVDPAFEERQRISTRVMYQEMGALMSEMEPIVRDGLAKSFARRFDRQQLADMDAFFVTPSGKAFADEYLLLMADPEMMKGMMELAPRFIQAMPEIERKIEAATAHLPPAPEPVVEDDVR